MPSINEKVDILYKKVIYGKSITGPFDTVFPTNETIATSPKVRGVDVRLAEVSPEPPTTSSPDISVYNGSGVYQDGEVDGTLRLTALSTSELVPGATNLRRTWQALEDDGSQMKSWIDPTYGSGYQVKVFVGPTADPIFSGTGVNCNQIFETSNSWYFDYDSGTFYIFDDTTSDNSFTNVWGSGKSIYIRGYRYISSATFNTMSYQNSNDVDITGGSILNLSDFSIVSGNNTLLGITQNDIIDIESAVINTLSVTSDMTVGGNLNVTGNIIGVQGTDVIFGDTILELNVPDGADVVVDPVATPYSGIQAYRGLDGVGGALQPAAQMVWDYANNYWVAGVANDLNQILTSDIIDDAAALYGTGTGVVTSDILKAYYTLASTGSSDTDATITDSQVRFARTVFATITNGSTADLDTPATVAHLITHNLNTQKVLVFGYKDVNGSYNPFIPKFEINSVDSIEVSIPTDTQGDTYHFVIVG